jgi:hypothetical protein
MLPDVVVGEKVDVIAKTEEMRRRMRPIRAEMIKRDPN